MFHKINKIQKTVDDFIELCNETENGQADDGPHSDLSSKHIVSLGEMILKAQEGDLSTRSMREMSRWLANDDNALRYYIEFQNLTTLLQKYFKSDVFVDHSICNHLS